MTSSDTLVRRAPVRLWWVALVCGLASFIDAAGLVASGIALVIYQGTIGITAEQIGLLSGLLTFGVAIGAIIGGRLGDRFGRRRVFIVTMVVVVVGAALLVAAVSFLGLVVGMMLLGLGIGADLPVSVATIAEAGTDENRGGAVVFSNVLWTVGIVASLLIGALAGGLGRLGGQLLFGMVGVVALVVLFLRLSIPESPLWLQARQERQQGIETIRADKVNVRDLLRAPYLVPFVVLAAFYTLMGIGANTGGAFGAFIAVNLAGIPVQLFSTIALGVLAVSVLAGIWFMRVVDTRHRMTYFTIGAVLTILSYAVLAIFGFSLPTLAAALVLGNIGGAFAFESILRVWCQESFPTMLRGTAQGTVLAVQRFIVAGVAVVTPTLLVANARVFYVGLTVLVTIGLLLAYVHFRKGSRNEFDVEQELDPEAKHTAAPAH